MNETLNTLLLLWERYIYTPQTTIGKLYLVLNGERKYFGYTCEDTVRPPDIKVMEHTAIPADVLYNITKFESPHYGRTLIIHTEKDGLTIRVGLLKWVGCLFHNGNDHEDTAGCVLVAANHPTPDTIQGGLKKELAEYVWAKLDEGYIVNAMAKNLPQLQ